jgi:hypothetical protein
MTDYCNWPQEQPETLRNGKRVSKPRPSLQTGVKIGRYWPPERGYYATFLPAAIHSIDFLLDIAIPCN